VSKIVLDIKDVVVEYPSQGGFTRAVDGVSLQITAGKTLAVVGESGCGKTTLARSVLGLQKTAAGKISLGGVQVKGTTRRLASKVGMVWQDPYASLNPKWPIKKSLEEPLKLCKKNLPVEKILEEVGLGQKHADRYPHEMSGGQRQRVAIGRALALRPPLVICDEPTAALDLSIQAQILNLLKDIQKELNCAYLFISHDLMTVQYIADEVAVMYLGRIVEQGPTEEVFTNPKHPYTKALLDSAPTLENLGHLPESAPGELPDPRTRFKACRFANRCPKVQPICREIDPPVKQFNDSKTWCYFPNNVSLTDLPPVAKH
jgi:oligopeptide/dipeptide ABC transporter ATP-binding protein